MSLIATVASAESEVWRGLAYDLETGDFLYTENHLEHLSPDGARLETTYRDPDGEVFARREVLFHERPVAPEFELRDERSGYLEGAEWQDGKARVYKREDGETEEALVDSGRHPLVIDAGFDALVTANWEALQAGERLRFDFLNADRLDRIPFRLELTGRRETPDGPVSDFEMSLANPMLRWLVDSIQVSYLDSDRKLYEYVGVSNIKDPAGGNYTVRIEFPRSGAEVVSSPVARADGGGPDQTQAESAGNR